MIRLKKPMKSNKGFTMIEVLIALLCVCATSILFTACAKQIQQLSRTSYASEDRIAIDQMRFILAQSKAVKKKANKLFFQYHQQEFYLEFDRSRLVKRKGYEIFLQNIDSLNITKRGKCYDISFMRYNIQKNFTIYCEL